MFYDDYPRCYICDARLSMHNVDGVCRLCRRSQEEALERDRADGIEYRCAECYEPNGQHIEGGCSKWTDGYPYEGQEN